MTAPTAPGPEMSHRFRWPRFHRHAEPQTRHVWDPSAALPAGPLSFDPSVHTASELLADRPSAPAAAADG